MSNARVDLARYHSCTPIPLIEREGSVKDDAIAVSRQMLDHMGILFCREDTFWYVRHKSPPQQFLLLS